MLQTRSGKRTTKAALKIAVDLVDGGHDHAARKPCCASTRPRSTSSCIRPSIPPPSAHVLATGLPASPGAAAGEIVFDCRRGRGARRLRAARSSSCASRPARGHPRHARRRRHPHHARRHDQPRRRRRPRHGAALRVRRRRAAHRLQGRHHDRRRPRPSARATPSPSTAPPARCSTAASGCASPSSPATSRTHHGLGRRARAASACAPMPTRRAMRRRRASSAPRASASAAPSTCSSRPTASSPCAR